jgi:hypothetical protein
MGLIVNTNKTVTMTSQMKLRRLQIAYSAKLRAQLRVPEYRQRWQALVECEVCGKTVQRRSLRRHCLHVHPELTETHQHPSLWSPEPVTQLPDEDFVVNWEADAETGTSLFMACPHDRCVSTRFKSPSMLYKHWSVAGHEGRLTIIDKRGEQPRDVSFTHQCPKCLLWMKNPVPPTHAHTKACKENTARRLAKAQQQTNEEEINRSPFKSKGVPLTKTTEFNYLGRTLTATNDDTLAIHLAIAKAKKKWAELRRILGQKPVKPKTFGRFYKAIVLNVLLYGSESWQINQRSLDALEAFHNKCVRTISGQPFRRVAVGDEIQWIRPPVEPLLKANKLKTITKYITTRRDNFRAKYQCQPTIDRQDVPITSYVVKRKLVFE